MPVYEELLQAVNSGNSNIDDLRRQYVSKLGRYRGRNVITYYSGWLQHDNAGNQLSISDQDMAGFMSMIHGLDRKCGLDLILHTPGGGIAETEMIIEYLKSCFGNDITAFVPQLAMSAGTMICCACKEIYMGRQSAIGPTDPQYNGFSVGAVIEEFEQAKKETRSDSRLIPMWSPILSQYSPTFLGECKKGLDVSRQMVQQWLSANMLDGNEKKAAAVADWLSTHKTSAMHNRHISKQTAVKQGLVIRSLEDDNTLQDLVLSIHHSCMMSFEMSQAIKIMDNSNGKSWIRFVPTRQ